MEKRKQQIRERCVQSQGVKDGNLEPLPIFRSTLKDLEHGGVAVDLFFITVFNLILVFSVVSLVSVVNLIDNILSHANRPDEAISLPLRTALGNTPRTRAQALTFQALPWAIVVVILVLFLIYLRRSAALVAKSVDERLITAADFSLEVRDIPDDATEAELKKHFAFYGPVYEVVRGYECGDYVKEMEKWHKLNVDRLDLLEVIRQKDLTKNRAQLMEGIVFRMEAVEKKLHVLHDKELKPTPAAFVTFEREHTRRKCLKAYHGLHWSERAAEVVWKNRACPLFRGRMRLTVLGSPEVSDVYCAGSRVPREVAARRPAFALRRTARVAQGRISTWWASPSIAESR